MKTLTMIGAFVLLLGAAAFAQDTLPDFYSTMFSASLLAAITMITTFTKYVTNLLGNVKGWLALVITFLVSMVYGFVQYGGNGIPFAVGAGLFAFIASAGIFKLTSLAGQGVAYAIPPIEQMAMYSREEKKKK